MSRLTQLASSEQSPSRKPPVADADSPVRPLQDIAARTAGMTSIRVLKTEWASVHGRKVQRGALKAETDTDYLVFTCPGCGSRLAGGVGISLKGVSDDFATLAPSGSQVLAFQIHCPICNFRDHFKLALDQAERYGPDGG